MKMWAGRFSKELDKKTNDFNSSISIDARMYEFDIKGSIAHARMLGLQDIIPIEDSKLIIKTLEMILYDLDNQILLINEDAEDIHMFIEEELTKRIGDVGKKLHTARSRNDQVALDVRYYLRTEISNIIESLKNLIKTICNLSEEHKETVMPGYTHLQRAQPITFALHLMAYANMFFRDIERLKECKKRMNVSPLGSSALAGTTYNIDRLMVAEELSFNGITNNSIDGVSDRDFIVELANDIAMIMMHLSRFSEEIVLWCSWEFKFVELDDAYSTGSSIMPQKKNPDVAELVRGKSGRCYGNLMTLLTMLKGLPLAYNKDMQEDKEAIFDSIDTVKNCLEIFTLMIRTMKVNKDNMLKASLKGFINATDMADYLTKKGMPFRDSYKLVGNIVKDCIARDIVLEDLKINEFKKYSNLFEEDIYVAISLKICIENRVSYGSASIASMEKQISIMRKEMVD